VFARYAFTAAKKMETKIMIIKLIQRKIKTAEEEA